MKLIIIALNKTDSDRQMAMLQNNNTESCSSNARLFLLFARSQPLTQASYSELLQLSLKTLEDSKKLLTREAESQYLIGLLSYSRFLFPLLRSSLTPSDLNAFRAEWHRIPQIYNMISDIQYSHHPSEIVKMKFALSSVQPHSISSYFSLLRLFLHDKNNEGFLINLLKS